MQKILKNLPDIIAAAFFILLSSVFPLYIRRTHYISITGDKARFFLVLTGAAFAAIAFVWFFTFSKAKFRRITVAEWAALAFLALAFLSSVFSPHGWIVWLGSAVGRWEGFWVVACYVFTFFIIGRGYRVAWRHLAIFAVSAIMVSGYGIMQFLGNDILLSSGFFVSVPAEGTTPWHIMLAPLTAVFRTTLGNTNIVAAYAGTMAVLFAALFAGVPDFDGQRTGLRTAYSIILHVLFALSSVLSITLLFISRGDAGHIGVLAAILLLTPYWLHSRARLGRIMIIGALWAAAFVMHDAYLATLQIYADPEIMIFWGDYWMLYHHTPLPESVTTLLTQAAIALAALGAVIAAPWQLLPIKPPAVIPAYPQKAAAIAGIAITVIIAVGGIYFIETQGRNSDNRMIYEARQILRGEAQDEHGSGRIFIWRHTMSIITDRPLLGSGPGTFFQAMGEEFQEYSRENYGIVFDTPHNIYLNTAITLGWPALSAFLTMLAALLIPAGRMAFKNPIILAFFAAAISYLVQGFFQVDTPIDRPLLWLALGVIAAELHRMCHDKRTKKPKNIL